MQIERDPCPKSTMNLVPFLVLPEALNVVAPARQTFDIA